MKFFYNHFVTDTDTDYFANNCQECDTMIIVTLRFNSFPLNRETRIPSIQSWGIGVPSQVFFIKMYMIDLTFSPHFCSNSTGMSSIPGALPELIYFIVMTVSSCIGSSSSSSIRSVCGMLSMAASSTTDRLNNKSEKYSFQRPWFLQGICLRWHHL